MEYAVINKKVRYVIFYLKPVHSNRLVIGGTGHRGVDGYLG